MTWLIDDIIKLSYWIGEYIYNGVYTIIDFIVYPIKLIFENLLITTNLFNNAFTYFINTFMNTGTLILDFTSNLYNGMFPSVWVFWVILGISIILSLRIYYFLKDVSIMGNKV